jgi:hypothetical protein
MLSYVLYAYCTIIRTSIGATLYFLVYGIKAMIPLKVEILSLRVLNDAELEESEYANMKFEQWSLINEKRLVVICHH